MVARAAFSIGVVVQHEQILTEQVVVGDLFKRGGFSGRVLQRDLFDRVGDAVDQIADGKVQVLARFRIILDPENRRVMVLHVDGRERGGLDALCVRGGHADEIAAVRAEIALTERNGQRRDLIAMVIVKVLGELKVAVPCVLFLIICDQLHRALAQRSVIGRDAVKPRLFFRGIVVEHDNHAALTLLVQNERLGVARVLAADSRSAESGLARQDAHVACVIVVGKVVIPKGERAVLDEVIREVVLAGVDRVRLRRAEGDRLGPAAGGQRDRARTRRQRQLGDRAVVRYLGDRRRHIRAVDRYSGGVRLEAVLERERKVRACIGGDDLRVRDLGVYVLVVIRGRAAAIGRTAIRGTARGRAAARGCAAGGRAARSLRHRLGLACRNGLAACLHAGNVLGRRNTGSGGGNAHVIGVRPDLTDPAGAGDLRVLCVYRDGADRRAALHGNGSRTGDSDAVRRACDRNVAVHNDALADARVPEGHAVRAAADQDAAGDGDVRQVSLRCAVCKDEVAVDSPAGERHTAAAHDDIAVYGIGQAVIRERARHAADDLGEFRTGDAAPGIESAVRAVDEAAVDQRGDRALCPRGNAAAVGVVRQSGSVAVQTEGARHYGKGFLTSDGRLRVQLSVRALERAHRDRDRHIIVVPCVRPDIGKSGEVGGFVRAEGAVDDGGHLRTGQQARTIDPSVRAVQQAVIHGAAQTGGGPVGREIVKILGGRGECVRYEHRAGQQQSEGLFLLQGSYPPYRLRLPEANRFSKKCPFPSERMEGSTACLRRSALRADHAVKVNAR